MQRKKKKGKDEQKWSEIKLKMSEDLREITKGGGFWGFKDLKIEIFGEIRV